MRPGQTLRVVLVVTLVLVLCTCADGQRRPRRLPVRRPPRKTAGRLQRERGVGHRPPRRRPAGGFVPPPPPPGPNLVVPANGASGTALRQGLDGVRHFQTLLSVADSPARRPASSTAPPPTTPPPRPHSTSRPPLSREQVAMLEELQSILGGEPLPIDPTTENSRNRPGANRRLPLFPPFDVFPPPNTSAVSGPAGRTGGGDISRRRDGGDARRRRPVLEAAAPAFQGSFSLSRLFASPLSADRQRAEVRSQFGRPAGATNELSNGVLDDAATVRLQRPPTVAPSAAQSRPTVAPSFPPAPPTAVLRAFGALRPAPTADADRGDRGARLVQNFDLGGRPVTRVFSSARPAPADERPPPRSSGFGFDSEQSAASAHHPRPGPALATGLRLHQVLTSTLPGTPPLPSVEVTTYNPQAHRNSVLASLSAASRDVGKPNQQRRQESAPSTSFFLNFQSPLASLGGITRERGQPASERSVVRAGSSGGSRDREGDHQRVSRKAVMPQNLEQLCGATADVGFCETDEQYPRAYMERVVDQCATLLEYLYSEVPADVSQLTAPPDPTPAGEPTLPRATGRVWSWAAYNYRRQDVCDATLHFAAPSYARATDGRWYVVVQHGRYRQRVSVGMCSRLGGVCRSLADCGLRSRCVQTFYHRTLIAADPRLPTKCPRMRTFRLPAGCQCQVELAKSLRTPGQPS